ncbi:hypothetical protein [Brachybacterium sp. ACRRE]|uniref:hypothetical protein n=1 Tax=Brachybacterium sp. ACRRE TaxID=2918184 RepID=UPI001EF33545|nr:hypothetical protein [Brachybacterium sp. ACRRE]MCG7311294.1 hypothetical protein [Brachybacterium sp. ACRRE]
MKGQRLGMLSLRLDALYCLVLGVIVAAASPIIAPATSLPTWLVLAAGVAVVVWAGAVEWMRSRLHLRTALRIVMTANVAATLAVAAVSFTAAAVLTVLVILAIAVDVAAFAGSQALALGRLRTRAS